MKYKEFLKTYLSYLSEGFSKKIFLFGLVVYLSGNLSTTSILLFILFVLNYCAVYFGNDLIDRKYDIKRNYIQNYKLILQSRQLLYLFLTHTILFSIILSFFSIYYMMISLFLIFFGILRSYIRVSWIREFMLFILQLVQIFLLFLFVGCPDAFLNNLFIILFYCTAYTFSYYTYRTLDGNENRTKTFLYSILCSVLYLLSLTEVKDLFIVFIIVFGLPVSLILNYTLLRKVKNNVKVNEFKDMLKVGNTASFATGILLIFLGITHLKLFIHIPNLPNFLYDFAILIKYKMLELIS